MDEFQVSSKTQDNCVEPTISQSIVCVFEGSCLNPKLVGWCKRQISPQDEDEVKTKHEAEGGLEKFRIIASNTHI